MMNDDAYSESRAVGGAEEVATHVHDLQPVSEPARAREGPDLSLWIASVLACQLCRGSEVREARIRELQAAIKRGAYHVPADLIADKMLRRTLRRDLT